ncbi:MAG: hypothetical protein LBJ31_00760 [Treponema sp.]|jgi:hypothetical protein|nr:hypothetical protein [Treponema sp.]
MNIEENIIKYYLRNVYFINGTAYAGKSTMVKIISEKYDMIFCGENYHSIFPKEYLDKEIQPGLCYLQAMKDWQEFINRTPEEYEKWINDSSKEATEIEIMELVKLSFMNKKIIVDTNISIENLMKISDYNHIALMICRPEISIENFFQRKDEDKIFIFEQIKKAKNPEKTMKNFKECLFKINNKETYLKFKNSGLFVLERENINFDTKEIMLRKLVEHFKL